MATIILLYRYGRTSLVEIYDLPQVDFLRRRMGASASGRVFLLTAWTQRKRTLRKSTCNTYLFACLGFPLFCNHQREYRIRATLFWIFILACCDFSVLGVTNVPNVHNWHVGFPFTIVTLV